MSVNSQLEAQILRYYHVEKWRIGTIARQLHVHHGTVQRVLQRAGVPPPARSARPSQIDPYLPFIRQTLERYPTLTASRLYAMVRERGYRGNGDHFRHLIALHRPRRPAEAYLRLTTLPAEMGQVDWGHFGHLEIGRARRPLMAFVMVLSWSRAIFLQFFLDARMESFLRGHLGAFAAWNGLPRILLYDNLLCGAPHKRFYVESFIMWSSPSTAPSWRSSGAEVAPHNGDTLSGAYIESSHWITSRLRCSNGLRLVGVP